MESNQKSGGMIQNRLETRQILENYEGSIISSIMSAKPSESGYGSASTTSGQDKSKKFVFIVFGINQSFTGSNFC